MESDIIGDDAEALACLYVTKTCAPVAPDAEQGYAVMRLIKKLERSEA